MTTAVNEIPEAANRRSLVFPCATVFIASFCIMVMELVAGRVIARYLGSSLYTWTSVIGVVLAGMTIGNYIGGRIADVSSSKRTLAFLFVTASLLCGVTLAVNYFVGEGALFRQFSWPLRVFCHVCLVFLLPSVLLGTISPFVAKTALDHGLATGRTVGNIYAWGAAGSIAGTFATGYYLIAAMGSIGIIWTVAALLMLMGLIYYALSKTSVKFFINNPPSDAPCTAANRRSLISPCATVFISSFCIMVIELVAGRVIARYLGSSLYTWTSVIGVVLAGMTLGYYIGGRIADVSSSKRTLAALFAAASMACVMTVVLNNFVSEWTWLWQFSWPLRVFWHVCLVFLLPSVLLGAISPVVAKIALEQGLATGRTVGNIYAWGAAGSIAGTFATGYYLIEAIGTVSIIWAVAALLTAMGLIYSSRFKIVYVWMLCFVSASVLALAPWPWARNIGAKTALRKQPEPNILYEAETPYCYISVKRFMENPELRTFNQDKLTHSCINMNDVTDLRYSYEQIYAALTHRLSRAKDRLSTLTIGGGGYVFPRYIEKMWPGSRIDVVEIDPGVTEAAMKAFGLQPDTTIRTISLDGRNYVDELIENRRNGGEKIFYDFIYEDAINNYSVPFQITTREFNDKISRLLTEDGVYMINLIDIFEIGRFLGAIVNTLRHTFSNVYVISEKNLPASVRNTYIIIAAKRTLNLDNIGGEYKKGLDLWHLSQSDLESLEQKSGGLVLTDNYAPVENLLAPVVRRKSRYTLFLRDEAEARKTAEQMQKLAWQARVPEAIKKLEEVVRLDSSMSVRVYNVLAAILSAKGKTAEALEVYQKAIAFHVQNQPKTNIASIYFNFAAAMAKVGQATEAAALFVLAEKGYSKQLEKDKRSIDAHAHLGEIARQRGKYDKAGAHFQAAVALGPSSAEYRLQLIKTLISAGRLNAAIEAAQKAIQAMPRQGQGDAVKQFQQYLAKLHAAIDQPSELTKKK